MGPYTHISFLKDRLLKWCNLVMGPRRSLNKTNIIKIQLNPLIKSIKISSI